MRGGDLRQRLPGRRQALTVALVAVLLIAGPIAQSATVGTLGIGTHLETDSGLDVTVSNVDLQRSAPFPNANSVVVNSLNLSATGPAQATVQSSTGQYVRLTGVDVSSNEITIKRTSGGAEPVTIGGDISAFRVRNVTLTDDADANEDLEYTVPEGGVADVTIEGLSPGVDVAAIDDESGETLDRNTTTASGTLVLHLPNAQHEVDLVQDGGAPYDVAPQPANYTYVPDRTVDVNATVINPEEQFVDVSLYHTNPDSLFAQLASGNVIQMHAFRQVLSGNQYSETVDAEPGLNKWYLRLRDSDHDIQTRTYHYLTPGAIQVYNATTKSLIDGTTVKADIDSLESGFAAGLSSDDGLIDLANASVPRETLAVEVSASGYYNRTITVTDPTRRFYVLLYPKQDTPGNYTQSFTLNSSDPQWPASDSNLIAERYYNGAWRRVDSDLFGTSPNRADLDMVDGVTYELTVQSSNGTVDVGRFTGDFDRRNETVEITILDNGYDDSQTGAGPRGSTDNQTNTSDGRVLLSEPPEASNPDPNAETVRTRTPRLNITVSDPDGQQINVTWYHSQSGGFVKIGTNTSVALGTRIRQYHPLQSGGAKSWYVVMKDENGTSATSRTFGYQAPGRLTIYDASNKTRFDNVPGSGASVTFVSQDSNFRETRSVGTSESGLNLTQLPVGETYRVTVNSSAYDNRSVIVDDISDDYSVALPPKADSYEQTFKLDDQTGRYPPANSTLIITRFVGGSRILVASDRFGADNEVIVDLIDGVTYRLRVKNAAGDSVALGRYVAQDNNETKVLTIRSLTFGDGQTPASGYVVDGEWVDDVPGVRVQYKDYPGGENTSRFEYKIFRRDGPGNLTLVQPEVVVSDPETYSELVPVAEPGTYVIKFTVYHGGNIETGEIVVGEPGEVGLPVDQSWLTLLSIVAIVAVGGLLVIVSSALAAVGMTVTAGALELLGWIAIPGPMLGLAGVASVVWAVKNNVGEP